MKRLDIHIQEQAICISGYWISKSSTFLSWTPGILLAYVNYYSKIVPFALFLYASSISMASILSEVVSIALAVDDDASIRVFLAAVKE